MITVVQNFICTIPERLDLVRRNTPKVANVWGDYEFIVNYNHEENFEEICEENDFQEYKSESQ